MKWIKHDTDANQDAKLQTVLLDYGLEGYGLYWYCIELIAGKVSAENITFELEHDSRIIARNTGSTPQKVSEMMQAFVRVGLFENSSGLVTCLKIAKRLDKSMTSNPEMRGIINQLKQSHDSVMTNPDLVMQDKNRLDKNRIEESRRENTNTGSSPECVSDQSLFTESKHDQETKPTKKPAKPKFTEEHKSIAEQMAVPVREQYPSVKINIDKWAEVVKHLLVTDKRPKDELLQLWQLIRNDTDDKHCGERWNGWAANCRAPDKLRKPKDGLKYYDVIKERLWPRQGLQTANGYQSRTQNNNGMHESGMHQETYDQAQRFRERHNAQNNT